MTTLSVSEIIARTLCEADRRLWSDLGPTERHRYFHTGRMAQDRIREALLDETSGLRTASDLIYGPRGRSVAALVDLDSRQN